MSDVADFTNLQYDVWLTAERNGWHDSPRSNAEILALVHSEVSEALEVDRLPVVDAPAYAEELADIVIRVMDHAETIGIDLETAIVSKNERNRGREYRHGGKRY